MSNVISTPNGNVFAPGLTNRSDRQHARVAQGIANGSLNSSEVANLKGMRRDAWVSLNQAKANDGRVDAQERAALHKDLNDLSKAIFILKHN